MSIAKSSDLFLIFITVKVSVSSFVACGNAIYCGKLVASNKERVVANVK